ncbi:hypothetical protein Ddye_010440 [Dipteronia dyeriana]|uniref:RNase H type-1 domain-containing protein n=1 Tax=Dipteronia dyeriana TaxID=168575 RepID=A0AAE0CNU4_9ROSI|nr:hypothetical protein Ddye_010435 [Dipteronia dyeriana]KAK2657388.1 hypothetical protein Ddye_010440 [Dipteronia dyeriana]
MDWIDCILRSLRLSVLIDGSPKGYFHCSIGVYRGDPLSPLLFGIAEDFLSRLLSRMVIFYRGTVRNLKNIMSAFAVYGNISDQLVNWGVPILEFLGISDYLATLLKIDRVAISPVTDSLVWAHSQDGQRLLFGRRFSQLFSDIFLPIRGVRSSLRPCAGGIFHNCGAFIKGCFVVPLDHVFAFEAELLAASIAINFAWQNEWHRIWLESDSSYMVQLLSSRSKQVP